MNKLQFESSQQLYHSLGRLKVFSDKDVRSVLCLEDGVSLWDIVASYMVLYRFPLCFTNKKILMSDWFRSFVRPYRGLLMQIKESLYFLFHKKNIIRKNNNHNFSRVLLLGFVPNFFRDVLRPVAEILEYQHGIGIAVVAQKRDSTFDISSKNKISLNILCDYWDNEARNNSRKMLNDLKKVKKPLINAFSSAIASQNILSRYGAYTFKREIKWLFWREFKRLTYQIALAKRILDKHKPKVIISADDADSRCRVYSFLAKKRGISTLLVQQGLSSEKYPEWSFFSQDVVAAMGESSSEDMRKQGVDPAKIVVTGHPGFDRLVQINTEPNNDIRKKLDIGVDQEFIFFASQPHYVGVFKSSAIRIEMIKAIIKGVTDVEKTRLVIKPHPGENVKELRKLVRNKKGVVLLDKTIEVATLLRACDVVITFHSTVALESLYIGKPVINVDFPNSGLNSIYIGSGATWIARSPDEITKHVQTLTCMDRDSEINSRKIARLNFLSNMTFQPDGLAGDRISNLVMTFLS